MSLDSEIRILIVDDHALFRSGLRNLLENFPGFTVVDEAANGEEFLNIVKNTQIDIVLLDIAMPKMNGIEAAEIALEKYPNLQIITLSMFGDEEYYKQMVQAGVRGFLLKDADILEVENAIRTVFMGRTYFSQELLQVLLESIKSDSSPEYIELSNREEEVLVQICLGKSNVEIAEDLCISKRTVEKHRANILEKTHCRNTASLVIYAIKNKIFQI
jgi:DNA-binding NarL/FixJ family response regulator